jgi:hypothetical protein
MENNYQYRGIYDGGELDRINTLLAEQEKGFKTVEKAENGFQKQAVKYGVIVLGITVLLVTLKFIKK